MQCEIHSCTMEAEENGRYCAEHDKQWRKEYLVTEIHNTLSDISNEDETIDSLEEAMEYFCSTWDKCEGYKHAIQLTLDDQNDNHFDELEEEHLEKLLAILRQ